MYTYALPDGREMYVFEESDYVEDEEEKAEQKRMDAVLESLSNSLIKMQRSVANFCGSFNGKKDYDTFMKNTTFNKSKKNRLCKYFSDLVIGRAGDDFPKIFEAREGDKRCFLQLLGAKHIGSDSKNFPMSDNYVMKKRKVIGAIEGVNAIGVLDFRSFIEFFGRMPYAYFMEGIIPLINNVSGYGDWSKLFTEVMVEGWTGEEFFRSFV